MQINIPDKILRNVEKPTRYTGGEFNQVIKDKANVKASFAFCFPDVYDVGMSHLGMRILYDIINKNENYACERVFSPWPDMEKLMRENNIPLYTLETKTPVNEFDVVGFTLQYEMCYTNVLNALNLSGIPLRWKDRTDNDPLVCAGGSCTYNSAPMAPFFDFVMMGEGEELIIEVMDVIAREKSSLRQRKLEELAKLPGIYVPAVHTKEKIEQG